MKILPTLLVLFEASAIALQATEPAGTLKQEPLPPGPLLQRIPDFSSWRVNFSYVQDQAKPADGNNPPPTRRDDTFFLPAAPRTLTITRTNPRWLAIMKDVQGNLLEQCFDGEREFVSGSMEQGGVPQGAFIVIPDFATGVVEKHIDFSRMDFPDMDWISKETYKGTQTNNERTYLVFNKGEITAWVDLASRFPVQWKKGGETRTFEQLPPPSRMVDLPPQSAALAEAIKKDLERLKRPGPPKMIPPRAGSGQSSAAMPTSQPAQ